MANLTQWATIATSLILLILATYMIKKRQARMAEYGSGNEHEIERKTGIDSTSKLLTKLIKTIKKEKRKIKNEEKQEKAQSKKENSEKSEVSVAKAAEESEETAEALTAIQGRAAGLIAGLRLIELSIENYANKESQKETKQNQETAYIERLISEITLITKSNNVDSQRRANLNAIINNLIAHLEAETNIEFSKDAEMKILTSLLEDATKEIKQVLKEAKTEKNVFKKFKRKEQKDYSAAIKELGNTAKTKNKQLNRLKKKSKENNEIVNNMERKIALIRRQHKIASKLNSKLQKTSNVINQKSRKLNRIIQNLLKKDKSIDKLEKTLIKTESKTHNASVQIRQSLGNLKKPVSSDQSNDADTTALSFSNNLNELLKKEQDVQLIDKDFDETLKGIVSTGFEMARLTEKYEKITLGLTGLEQAADQSTKVLAKIVQSVTSDQQLQAHEEKVINALDKLTKLLDYQKAIENRLHRITKALESKLMEVYSSIDRLSNQDSRMANSIYSQKAP